MLRTDIIERHLHDDSEYDIRDAFRSETELTPNGLYVVRMRAEAQRIQGPRTLRFVGRLLAKKETGIDNLHEIELGLLLDGLDKARIPRLTAFLQHCILRVDPTRWPEAPLLGIREGYLTEHRPSTLDNELAKMTSSKSESA